MLDIRSEYVSMMERGLRNASKKILNKFEFIETKLMFMARNTMGIPPSEMADRLGISVDSVLDMECGKKDVSEAMIEKINTLMRQHENKDVSGVRRNDGKVYPCDPQAAQAPAHGCCPECAKKDKALYQLTETVSSLTRQLEKIKKVK